MNRLRAPRHTRHRVVTAVALAEPGPRGVRGRRRLVHQRFLALADHLAVADDGSATTFLDIGDRVSRAGNEEGLLSIALDPADPDSLWVYYSVAAPRRSRLSRFTIVDGTADPNSELVTLDMPQPFSNHNGGAVRFKVF